MKIIKVNHWSEIPENFTGIVEFSNGTKYWLKAGVFHREDGPAIEWVDGDKEWYKDGKHHREDAPAVEFPNGGKQWYKEGMLHRLDGPAIEWADGTKHWYKDGKHHREDGPAVEWANGEKRWFLEDQKYSQINLKDHIVLDSYQGKYNLTWYKLLGEDKVIDYPDIPGLIEK